MLVFVIPLQNPETAQDWDRCNRLCQQTVKSALAQTDADVRVIVVCKDFTPDTTDPRLTVLRRPFPALANDQEAPHEDKQRKIAIGLVEARKLAPCYIMKLDADDLVSRNLSMTVHAGNYRPGYYIARGYRWREGSRFVRPLDNFHMFCGSSSIIWCASHELPSTEDDDMSSYRLLRLGHHVTVEAFAQAGTPLQPIAVPSVIYRTGHGNNMSWRFRRRGVVDAKPNWKFYVGRVLALSELRPLTPSLKREFFGGLTA